MIATGAVAALLGLSGIGAMRAALERGDVAESARQGALAGIAALERALAAPDRTTRLAAIAAAPAAGELPAARAELLPALASVAAAPDRRVAIPAARAAREIARDLRGAARPPGASPDLPDDVAPADLAAWRAPWAALAAARDRWIELRVLALDTAVTLTVAGERQASWEAALSDDDPAMRRAAVALTPAPVPGAARAALARLVRGDPDPDVARDAAAVLCADLASDPPGPVLEALGPAGLARARSLAQSTAGGRAARDAARCLTPPPTRPRP